MVVSMKDNQQESCPINNPPASKLEEEVSQQDMSDEDKGLDIESDDDADSVAAKQGFSSLEEKRAHHNALERKRRDHIKDSFCGLRDSIPSLEGEKSSRAQILHKATEHIQYMRRKNHANQADIDELKRHNMLLDQQVRQLEKAKASGTLESVAAALFSTDTSLLQNNNTGGGGENNMMKAEEVVSNGPVLLERHGNHGNLVGDHDDYTIVSKRPKPDPS